MSKPEPVSAGQLDQWAERIHRSGLAVVILPLLELGRGFGFLASQALLMIQPAISALVNPSEIDRYAAFLEDPTALEDLIGRVEQKAETHG